MTYTISKVSQKTGLSAYTLRYYDKEGLLPFVHKNTSGIREFTDEDLDWLSIITCLKNTGMPIKDIKTYINLCLDGDSTLEDRLNIFLKQKESIERQTAELDKYMKKITYKIQYYEDAIKAGSESIHKKNGTKENNNQ